MRQVISLLIFLAASGSSLSQEDTAFHFARLKYDEYSPEMFYPYETYSRNWYTDYSDGTGRTMESYLMPVIERLTTIRVAEPVVIVPEDRNIFRYPFLYTVEPEQMVLRPQQADNLREWLNRGGFWMLDDFHGCQELEHVLRQLKRVVGPRLEFKKLTTEHPLFHTMFDISEIVQVPVVWIGEAYAEDPTRSLDEVESDCRGPMVFLWESTNHGTILLTFNVDLGDAMEWADYPCYPQKFPSYTYRLFTNILIYSLSH